MKIKELLSSKLVKSTGIYTIAKVINSCIPFFLLPIMTAYLTPSDYGVISMITTVVAFVTPFVTLSMDSAVVRRYYYKGGSISEYIGTCFLIVAVLCLIVTLLMVLFGSFLSDKVQIPEYILWAIPIYCVFIFFKTIVLYNWQVKGEPVKYGIFSIISTLIEVSIAITLIVKFGFNWQGRAISLLSTGIILALFSVIYLRNKGMIELKYNKEYANHATKYGLGLIPHALGGSLMVLSNRFFITNMVSIDETGLYGVASSLSSILSFITLSFNNAYVPWLFERLSKKDEKQNLQIVRVTYVYLFFIVVLGFLSYLFIILIFPFFVNSSFDQATKYIPWLIAGYVFQGGYFMMTNYILYSEKTYYNGIVTIFTGLLSLLLNYLFIKQYGAVGAAIAFACTYIFYFIITWVIANKVCKMPWFKIRVK